MIETILNTDVATPIGMVESVFRTTGIAHLASLHPSPVGDVVVVRWDQAVTAVVPEEHADAMLGSYERRTGVPAYPEDSPPVRWAENVGAALTSGEGRKLAIRLPGLSDFQQDVLNATRRIPVGETRPYSWVARESHHPSAVRAVGTALGNNPVPLLIPCHRVVRSDGSLGQYAFGPEMKAELLAAEDYSPRADAPLVGARRGAVACYPSCRHARRLKDPVAFKSLADAERAGFRACKDCRPA